MKRLISIPLVIVALLAAGSALAGVAVYKNAFKSRGDFGAVHKLGGGKCGKSWKDKKQLGFTVKQGREECMLATPVEGDTKQPDQTIQAIGKVGKNTDKKIRDSVYVGVALRANAKSAYELRVFPKGRRWQLLKNGGVADSGREKSIKELGADNSLRLSADGAKVSARVNGAGLATFRDNSPEEVSGRKSAITFGNTKNSKKDGVGTFDKVTILVPDP
jgi:hypothetical protein